MILVIVDLLKVPMGRECIGINNQSRSLLIGSMLYWQQTTQLFNESIKSQQCFHVYKFSGLAIVAHLVPKICSNIKFMVCVLISYRMKIKFEKKVTNFHEGSIENVKRASNQNIPIYERKARQDNSKLQSLYFLNK